MEIKFIAKNQFTKKRKEGVILLKNDCHTGKIGDVDEIGDTNISLVLKTPENKITDGRSLYFALINLRELTQSKKIKNLLIDNAFVDNVSELKSEIVTNTFSTVFESEDLNIFIEEYRAERKR